MKQPRVTSLDMFLANITFSIKPFIYNKLMSPEQGLSTPIK